jgi:chromosome segregation ATPase
MAAATKKAKPAAKPARRPVAKRKPKSSLDYLQQALDDLDKARVQAQKEARMNIDKAVERIRDAVTELRARTGEPTREFEERLEQATEDARRELGKLAVQAQRSPEALAELTAEIRRREQALNG